MEPFTLAGIVALVLVGIFNKTGEVIVEESVEQIKKQLAQKSPDTLEQLEKSSEDNTDALAQPIEMMATLIEKDGVFKQLAETVAKQNLDKQAQAVKIIKNLEFIAEAGSNVTVEQNFYLESPVAEQDKQNRYEIKNIPPQFQTLIADKTEDFVGREYVFNEIHSFITSNSKGYFTVIGDPGQGKSAILAKYVQNTSCIAYFNSVLDGLNRTEQFLESICNQLIERYQLDYPSLPPNATQDGKFLERLLNESVQKESENPIIIVVDALDEVDQSSYRGVSNILFLPSHLPNGVYFILTLRRGVNVPMTVDAPSQLLNLLDDKYQVDSERDVRTYIQNRVKKSEKLRLQILERKETDADFTDKISNKSENNFMYLRYVLSDIEKGEYKDLTLEQFPKGLQSYYMFHWRRMGMTDDPLPVEKIRIVIVLAAVKQAVSQRKVCDYSRESPLTVQDILLKWRQFLHEIMKDNEKRYGIYHSSYKDFLHGLTENDYPVTFQEIHKKISQVDSNLWKKRKEMKKRRYE